MLINTILHFPSVFPHRPVGVSLSYSWCRISPSFNHPSWNSDDRSATLQTPAALTKWMPCCEQPPLLLWVEKWREKQVDRGMKTEHQKWGHESLLVTSYKCWVELSFVLFDMEEKQGTNSWVSNLPVTLTAVCTKMAASDISTLKMTRFLDRVLLSSESILGVSSKGGSSVSLY